MTKEKVIGFLTNMKICSFYELDKKKMEHTGRVTNWKAEQINKIIVKLWLGIHL